MLWSVPTLPNCYIYKDNMNEKKLLKIYTDANFAMNE